jgi:cytidyltransferase-like protein
MSKEKRVMVDMSATLIHHGHVRLLKKASKYGKVIVGLTADEEIFTKKGYQPELDFEYRKEILESIKYVSEVVAVPWLLDDKYMTYETTLSDKEVGDLVKFITKEENERDDNYPGEFFGRTQRIPFTKP